MKLNPVRYQYDTERFPALGLTKGAKIGLLAQDVESVFPELVTEVGLPEDQQTDDIKSIKAIDYVSLIPVLVGAIQEQQARIVELEAKVAELGGR